MHWNPYSCLMLIAWLCIFILEPALIAKSNIILDIKPVWGYLNVIFSCNGEGHCCWKLIFSVSEAMGCTSNHVVQISPK